jgi:hypothetical protein
MEMGEGLQRVIAKPFARARRRGTLLRKIAEYHENFRF